MNSYKNKHSGKDIWILGSGKSLDFVDNSFFENKITIGVNLAYNRFNLNYNIWHHYYINNINEAIKNTIVFVSEYRKCQKKSTKFTDSNIELAKKVIIYKHNEQTFTQLDPRPIFTDTEEIMTGGTTIINAVGLAVHMGAKNIILCGCDNGSIENEVNYIGYYKGDFKPQQQGHSLTSFQLMKLVRIELKKINTNMYMLNPFLDFNLEGLKYDQTLPESQKERENFIIKLYKSDEI